MKKTCLLAATILLPLSAQEISAGYSDFEFASVKGVSTDRTGPREEVAAMIYWKLEVHAHRARLSIGSQAEIAPVLDYNIAQHRILAALGTPR